MRSNYSYLKKFKPSYFPAVTWFIISFILLTLPGSAFPKENWFDKIWLDKWIHIGLFAILVLLWNWAFLKKVTDDKISKKIFIGVGIVCLAYGISMEFVQKYFIANRSFDIKDIIADGIGCALGVFYSIWRFAKK